MARINTPVSDDDFDRFCDVPFVDDVSFKHDESDEFELPGRDRGFEVESEWLERLHGTPQVRHAAVQDVGTEFLDESDEFELPLDRGFEAESEWLERLHGTPQVRHAAVQDVGTESLAQQLSTHAIVDDIHRDPIGQRTTSNAKSGSGFVSDGVKYTKSMYNKLRGKDALIAVMGMTGSGKTTFISKVTGRKDLVIGHDLTSCTRDIQVVETKINGRTVRFVDTPGFSDTTLSDSEVLQMIADYLAAAYKQEVKLSGVIYIHPISDNRVTQHATKNLEMFRKLTGDKNLENIILATSMWDKVTEDEGNRREDELKGKFWKLLIALGAKTVRHNDTPESARQIASMLLANEPFYVQLQEEMGKNNTALQDTEAGREVMLEIARMKEDHQRELAELENTIKNSAMESKTFAKALEEEHQVVLDALQKARQDEKRMNAEAVRSLQDRIHALENRGPCAVM